MSIKSLIINEFYTLSPKIISDVWLEKYVDFCLTHTLPQKVSGKSTSHHILPVAKTLPFKKYSNLKENSWNKAELYYSDHYYAHFLLAKAINHIATLSAFSAMHKRDIIIDRLSHDDLIPKEIFDEIWSERNNKISEYRLEKVIIDGQEMTRAKHISKNIILSDESKEKMSKRISGKNNPTKKQEVVDKIRNKKSNTYINGKNLDTISAEKAAQTMNKQFIDENGNTTTIYNENGKKISKTYMQIEENGRTKAYNKNKKIHQKLRNKGKWYIVRNVFDETYECTLPAAEVRKISPGLEKCTKEKFLGKSKFGQTVLKNKGKSNLIGLYVEQI